VSYGDLLDQGGLEKLLDEIQPDEIYNLAAQSHVKVSFDIPEYTGNADGLGVMRILEIIKNNKLKAKLFQASTSELFGGIPGTQPQNELTSFCPKSPYSIAKMYGYYMINTYRKAYDIFAVNGITFNHESPRRGLDFVTRKVTNAVVNMSLGLQDVLEIGNLDAIRDWGYSPDYVKAFWMMLQNKNPIDYVIATGIGYSIRGLIEIAFSYFKIDIEWKGDGQDEVGLNKKDGKVLVVINPAYFRPSEVEVLIGDSTKIQKELGWKPEKDFISMIYEMIDSDLSMYNSNET
jgi:GDPmannose 4,6-dehydratase